MAPARLDRLVTKPNRRAGFTLVELLMVLAIVAVVGGAAVAALRPYSPRRKVERTALLLVGALRHAHQTSILKGTRARLVISRSEAAFWVEVEENPLVEPGTFTELTNPPSRHELEEGVSVHRLDLSDHVLCSTLAQLRGEEAVEGKWVLEFTPGGTAPDAIVHLRHGEEDAAEDQAAAARIGLRGLTGDVKILLPGEEESYPVTSEEKERVEMGARADLRAQSILERIR